MNACELNIELTILMPCLNEAETLAKCIQKAKAFLQTENVHGEILIADNGSNDGSQQIAREQGAIVVTAATRGYGAALKDGIIAARGRYIIMGDADDSYDFMHLKPFLEQLRAGVDLVMGNRFKGGIMSGAMPFLNRYLGNPVLSFFGRLFYKNNIGDFHCGLRGFKRDKIINLNLQGTGMEFASEMIIKATHQQLKITEVPTQLFKDGRSRRPHLRPWRDGWRHLRLLLLFSPRWLFVYPGALSFLCGTLLMLLLIQGPLTFGHVQFDIHTLLFSALFIILGAQIICLGIFAKFINAKNTQHQWLQSYFTLERGLLCGALLMILGGSIACYALWCWWMTGFGQLLPTMMMRIIIPSFTLLVLGMQFIFASFFMNILIWHVREK